MYNSPATAGFFYPALTRTFTYGKKEKLKSRKAIQSLFAKGQSFSHLPFRVFWQTENAATGLQAGVGVRKSLFKKAVDRNRIKRLMREAWRMENAAIKAADLCREKQIQVFILYTGREMPEYEYIRQSVKKMTARLYRFLHEQD